MEVPAPRPQRHLPSATYRGSSSSQGRGRSSSERSVRPTVPLKGAGANQPAPEESGGRTRGWQNHQGPPWRSRPNAVSSSRLPQLVLSESSLVLRFMKEGGFFINE